MRSPARDTGTRPRDRRWRDECPGFYADGQLYSANHECWGSGPAARRVVCRDRRQGAVEPLDLDKTELTGAALREPRGAGVARQHIRVAMRAERSFGGRLFPIVPHTGRQLLTTTEYAPQCELCGRPRF